MATKPGTLGRVHVTNDRELRYPALYAQDQPVRGSVAVRRGAAAVYVGPFGLSMYARDTQRDWFGRCADAARYSAVSESAVARVVGGR